MELQNKASKPIFLYTWIGVLALFIVGGLTAGIMVFVQGLSITNLSDLVPWGLWITVDLSSIALAAGAFSLCAVVYLLGIKKYEPVARTATYIGIVGYSMAMMCLLLDIGRPDRFWHGFVFWNTHSVLWEVTMCVGLYFSVLMIEVLPIVGSNDILNEKFPKIASFLRNFHRFAPVLAVAGLFLSMLHQSSLGATYGVIQAKPIWYRPSLSILFIFSAVLGGISLTVFVSMISSKLSSKANVIDELLENLAKYVGWGLVFYLYFRFWDVFAMTYTYQPGKAEGLSILTSGSLAVNFWFFEILIGIIVPLIILLNSRLRKNTNYRMLALFCVVAGVVAYRWDMNLVGQLTVLTYLPNDITVRYASYTPSLIEYAAAGGIIAFGILAITIGVLQFKIVDHRRQELH